MKYFNITMSNAFFTCKDVGMVSLPSSLAHSPKWSMLLISKSSSVLSTACGKFLSFHLFQVYVYTVDCIKYS